MKRFACCAVFALVSITLATPQVFAQAKPTPPPAQAAPSKFVKPIKGIANIEIIQGPSKKVGSDVVTVIKIKNTSAGAIALLKVDEYWYDRKPKPEVVTGDSQVWRKPFNPGEIIEITMKSPIKPGAELYRSQYQYSHANGKIEVKAVKKFS